MGSRDGAAFDGSLPEDEQRTFRRQLSPELIQTAAAKVGIDTWCAAWTASLRYPDGLKTLAASGLKSGILVTSGHGERSILDSCLNVGIDAISLLIDTSAGPTWLTLQEIIERRRRTSNEQPDFGLLIGGRDFKADSLAVGENLTGSNGRQALIPRFHHLWRTSPRCPPDAVGDRTRDAWAERAKRFVGMFYSLILS